MGGESSAARSPVGRAVEAVPFPGMSRRTRVLGTLVLTGLAVAYLVWKIDLGTTVDVLVDADPWWFALAVAIMVGTVPLMAVRWRWLLAAQGIHDRLPWLTRSYFVSYSAGQLLPTAIGGDAVRVVESARRHPGRAGDLTAIVALERGLGGAATLALGAVGFVLAIGHYDVSAYLWIEGALVARHGAPALPVLLARGTAAAAAHAAPARAGAARPCAALVLRRRAPLPRPSAPARRSVRLHDGRAGGARARHLGVRAGGRHRARPAHLLRDGAAVLPRHARPVHAQRLRHPRGVLRQLPRLGRCRGRPGVRRRVPVLPRHRRAGAPRRARSCSGKGCAGARVGRASSMAEAQGGVDRRRGHLQRPAVDRAVPRQPVAGRTPSWSTTGRRTERSPSSASVTRRSGVVEQENLGLAAGWNRGIAGDAPASSC